MLSTGSTVWVVMADHLFESGVGVLIPRSLVPMHHALAATCTPRLPDSAPPHTSYPPCPPHPASPSAGQTCPCTSCGRAGCGGAGVAPPGGAVAGTGRGMVRAGERRRRSSGKDENPCGTAGTTCV